MNNALEEGTGDCGSYVWVAEALDEVNGDVDPHIR